MLVPVAIVECVAVAVMHVVHVVIVWHGNVAAAVSYTHLTLPTNREV